MFIDPPACPDWCTVHNEQSPRWDLTRTAVTRTCERRVLVEDGGERHEIALQRFAAVEFGELRCDAPHIRVNDGDAITLDHALNLAEALCRVAEIAGEAASLAA